MKNRRAKLPLEVRRPIQRFIRNFAFASLAFIAFWNMYHTYLEYIHLQDITKIYGFGPARIL